MIGLKVTGSTGRNSGGEDFLLLVFLWLRWLIYRYTLVLLEAGKLYQMALKSQPGDHGDADDCQLLVICPWAPQLPHCICILA